jgi:hypothetical protein
MVVTRPDSSNLAHNPGLGMQNENNQPRHDRVGRRQFAVFGILGAGVVSEPRSDADKKIRASPFCF